MRVFGDGFGGVSGVVNQNFLRGDQHVHGLAIGFDVESAIGRELQEVEASQVAGGVVEEHVFAARVTGVDAGGIFRSVPAVDGGVVLHAGIAATPGGIGNLLEQVFGFVSVDHAAVHDGAGGKIGVAHHSHHEIVSYADRVIRVLEKDGAVGVGVGMRSVVTLGHEGVGFGFFFTLAIDEVNDVGMVDVEDDHFGGAAGLASGLDDAGEGVEAFHEAERAAGGAAAAEDFGGGTERGKICAGA